MGIPDIVLRSFLHLAAAGALLLSCGGQLSAQDKRSDDFYSRDFARGGVSGRKSFFDGKCEADTGLRGGSSLGGDAVPGQKPGEEASAKVNSAPKLDDVRGQRVMSVGVVVNGMDKAHFDKQVKELLSLARERQLKIGVIDVIGTPGGRRE